jgi:hypothetical protein
MLPFLNQGIVSLRVTIHPFHRPETRKLPGLQNTANSIPAQPKAVKYFYCKRKTVIKKEIKCVISDKNVNLNIQGNRREN